MGATKEKLLEAEYFLAQMEEKRADRAPFKYSLSAFLAAARSVTLFAQKEFKRARGFDEWYAKKQEEMSADPAMRFFLKARNIALKREHVPTRAHINVTVSSPLRLSASIEPVRIRVDGTREEIGAPEEPTPPQAPTPERSESTTAEWAWYFEDLPDNVPNKDVVTLCAEHTAKLRGFVEKCEAAFSS